MTPLARPLLAPPRPASATGRSGGSALGLVSGPRALLCLVLVLGVLLGAPAAPALSEDARWQWPLDPPHQVLVPFDPPAHRYGAGHRGVDLAVPAAPTPVRAVEAGTVRFSGTVAGRGVVSVVHADGLISTYEPVEGVLEAGVPVQAGTVIGTVEDRPELAHCPAATCLHLGARRGEDYLDPMLLLGLRGPSVLLPWGGGAGGARSPLGMEAPGPGPQAAGADADADAVAPKERPAPSAASPFHGPRSIPGHRMMARAVLT